MEIIAYFTPLSHGTVIVICSISDYILMFFFVCVCVFWLHERRT